MPEPLPPALDLTPPPFAEGLCDWSRGDGAPASPSYETGEAGRIAQGDPDFGACLELRKVEAVQRLRYRGELPLRPGACIEITARIKALRGPLPAARIAASPGGAGGAVLPDLPGAAPATTLAAHGAVRELRAVIGRAAAPGVDLVWDGRALYGHVGLDLIGPSGGVVRIADLAVREILGDPRGGSRALPGFEAAARDRARGAPWLPGARDLR